MHIEDLAVWQSLIGPTIDPLQLPSLPNSMPRTPEPDPPDVPNVVGHNRRPAEFRPRNANKVKLTGHSQLKCGVKEPRLDIEWIIVARRLV